MERVKNLLNEVNNTKDSFRVSKLFIRVTKDGGGEGGEVTQGP